MPSGIKKIYFSPDFSCTQRRVCIGCYTPGASEKCFKVMNKKNSVEPHIEIE